ncbi:MAG: PilW family protein [Gammaproteobacteria bacterium]|nr:PilW family protein [Gammaproteobacteria bacterium]
MNYQYTHSVNTHSRQHGIGLVEIMIAMVLGLLLLNGVIQIFIANKQSYRTAEELGRMQENTRYAMHMLASDIRKAGYWGCISMDSMTITNNLDSGGGINLDGSALEGTEGSSNSPDTITLRGAYSSGIRITQQMPANSGRTHTTENNGLQIGDIIMISDCVTSDITQITGPSNADTLDGGQTVHNSGNTGVTPGNSTQSLSKSYSGDSSVFKAMQITYSIQTGAGGHPSLFKKINANAAEEIVEGVESLQVLYGRDTDSDGVANLYTTANNITGTQWDDVVSVRFGLLMRTIHEVASTTDTSSYTLAGATINSSVHSQGKYQRYIAQSTIKLRNRGCGSTYGC